MAQRHIALRALTARQDEEIRAARCGGFLPHPSPLPWGVSDPSLRGEQSCPAGFPLRDARCSPSPRERVRVRGKGANYPLADQTIPGTIELRESSARAGGFPE